MILVVKISKDGYFGISGGLDSYLALWNCQKKLLLSKIDIPGHTLKAACNPPIISSNISCIGINLTGEEFMFTSSSDYSIQVYHHFQSKKQVQLTFTLQVSFLLPLIIRNTKLK